MDDRVFSVEEVNQERIERAYRLAFQRDTTPPANVWAHHEAPWLRALGFASPASHDSHLADAIAKADRAEALNYAILALALLDEGGGKLGRWEVRFEGRDLRHGEEAYAMIYYRPDRTWVYRLPPGAYLDGTAQELLLLMAAADELSRREVQP